RLELDRAGREGIHPDEGRWTIGRLGRAQQGDRMAHEGLRHVDPEGVLRVLHAEELQNAGKAFADFERVVVIVERIEPHRVVEALRIDDLEVAAPAEADNRAARATAPASVAISKPDNATCRRKARATDMISTT